ncbi:hypothetical protein K239x_14410 [Planctomycetes bacterium K23_9]|uniref:Tetratricopeptide repeat protein n=2 Tax=Stieleria marina TaxID=1930275 RepID=A0A517NQV5_9BACT|nr:hypothetical protein K239x_14410 [Planctomycetes bacterium K23_9]
MQSTSVDGQVSHGLNMPRLDEVLNNLHRHAASYPTRFANEQDQARARDDATKLSVFFDTLDQPDQKDGGMLLRSAMLNAMAHHLDIAGSMSKADQYFERLIQLKPDAANAHQQYGLFLASSARSKQAVKHLTQAKLLGARVGFPLAMAHFATGDRNAAIEQLNLYLQNQPHDQKARRMLAAIQDNRAFVKSK